MCSRGGLLPLSRGYASMPSLSALHDLTRRAARNQLAVLARRKDPKAYRAGIEATERRRAAESVKFADKIGWQVWYCGIFYCTLLVQLEYSIVLSTPLFSGGYGPPMALRSCGEGPSAQRAALVERL